MSAAANTLVMRNPMKIEHLSCAAVLALFATFVPAHAHAQTSDCNSVTRVGAAMWSKFGERIKAKACGGSTTCLAIASKKEELFKELLAFWNSQAGSSWATIGPRQLMMGGSINDGKVVVGGSRLFFSTLPATEDTVVVTLTKQSGGAAKVTVAGMADGTTTCETGASYSFDKGSADGTVRTLTLNNAKGKFIYVKVDAASLDAFDYRFTAVER